MDKQLRNLQSHLGIQFHNFSLLKQAFTHSSYVNEHRITNQQDNERLEFLGDAVLELSVSEFLFQTYPDRPEGELTKIRASMVCEPSLVKFAMELKLGSYVYLGKGEELTGGRTRPSLLADIFESLIGAIYLDQGLDQVKIFLNQTIFSKIKLDAEMQVLDYKSKLQEYTQHYSIAGIEYRIVEERGPAHDREFVTEVYIDGSPMGHGMGRSKKESEQQAAAQALDKLKVLY